MLIALSSGQKTGMAVMAAVFVLIAIGASMLVPRFWPDFPGRWLKPFIALSVLLMLGMLTAVVLLAKEDEAHGAEPGGTHTTTMQTTTGGGDPKAGAQVFAEAGCAACHTLKAANSTGTVGPNLDEAKPSFALVVERVTNGKGPMPPFAGQLSEQEIKDVAAFVVASTHGG